jgi:(2Fe-2S) ferredoxin
MVSASNIQPYDDTSLEKKSDDATTVLILPAFTFVDNVTGADIPALIERFVDAPTNQSNPVESEKSVISSHRSHLQSRDCVHDYVVLLCSHKRRDARCGISAPLIKKELERHLRPLGLYRDGNDERPGGVGIYFVSHVGGHKFSANVLVYRKKEGQLIWLARIRPEHCEGIVKYTLLQGKVVHPESQLRGGFDRERGLTSW